MRVVIWCALGCRRAWLRGLRGAKPTSSDVKTSRSMLHLPDASKRTSHMWWSHCNKRRRPEISLS